MVIFHSYVSLPEGKVLLESSQVEQWWLLFGPGGTMEGSDGTDGTHQISVGSPCLGHKKASFVRGSNQEMCLSLVERLSTSKFDCLTLLIRFIIIFSLIAGQTQWKQLWNAAAFSARRARCAETPALSCLGPCQYQGSSDQVPVTDAHCKAKTRQVKPASQIVVVSHAKNKIIDYQWQYKDVLWFLWQVNKTAQLLWYEWYNRTTRFHVPPWHILPADSLDALAADACPRAS